ncbi:SDR family NAD(P)-dependent oxidoreductase [Woodsholea maritima]|uniref:SDR family NAD(P)-dependent oxidoreductase n=1 Tax=Woodsholea maritima TaxID=240237 RepID=UPI00037F4F3C|nr:SDR family NAD(P)-dependent oxidoreductase [Woodsholea maritima]
MSHATALVTGGAKRMGAAFVRALAERGHPVGVHFNSSEDEAASLVQEIIGAGGRADLFRADLSESESVKGLIGAVSARLGPVGVLVNSASLFLDDDLTRLSPDSFLIHQKTNTLAPLLLAQAMAAQTLEKGLILNVLDYKLFNLNADYLSYTISKYALKGITEILARRLAPHIRVNALAPGLTLPSAHHSAAEFERLHHDNPLRQGAQLSDMIRGLNFFLDTPSVTGQILTIDGGQHFDPRLTRDVFEAL